MQPYRPNREKHEKKETLEAVKKVYVPRLMLAVLKRQIVHADGDAEQARPQAHFRAHYDPGVKEKPSLSFHHQVDVAEISWKTLPRWPRTFKECSRRAQDFNPPHVDSRLHAFESWKSLWRFVRYTLTELAREVSADLSSDMRCADLRRTMTWAPRNSCVEEHASDMDRTSTWPKNSKMQQMNTPPQETAICDEDIGTHLSATTGDADMPRTVTWAPGSHPYAEHSMNVNRTTSWPKASKTQRMKAPSKKTVKRALLREQIKTPSDHSLRVSRW